MRIFFIGAFPPLILTTEGSENLKKLTRKLPSSGVVTKELLAVQVSGLYSAMLLLEKTCYDF